jgi:putative ATPase
MILYGPPGTGKTTLARLVAVTAHAAFEELSAVEAGRAEVRKVIERAAHRRKATGEPTIFFLDEIHRFNKAQQDTLLPAVEEGLVTLVGATTENPYFEVNGALLSRSQVYELSALSAADVEVLLRRALDRDELHGATADDDAIAFLADRAGGDARTALAALELAAATVEGGRVTLEAAEDALQRHAVRYDKDGDQHYDTISAWIKACRASDPDAGLYYLAVMLEGGEDPRFMARRMVIFASEDIGNADPHALSVATAAAAAVEHVGMPEAEFALSQATIYLALAPKSKEAANAIWAARAHVREHGAKTPPPWLRSSGYPGAASLGRGEGYEDPHRCPGHLSRQDVMPPEVSGTRFWQPDEQEAELRERHEQLRAKRGIGEQEAPAPDDGRGRRA